jgi:hypothetical protein
MLKPRIVKNKDCPRCAAYMKRLDKLGVSYITLDIANEDTKTLDSWKITNMPIVQIVDEEKKVLWQFPFSEGGISPRAINYKIVELSKEKIK